VIARGWWLLGVAGALWLCAGCSERKAAPLVEVEAANEIRAAFDVVLERFARMYIEPAAIDPAAMLDGGVAELDERVAALSSHPAGADGIELEIAGRRARVSRRMRDLDELSARLAAVTGWVERNTSEASAVELRAAALRGAVRAVDRWGSVLEGHGKETMMNRFRGSTVGVGCRVGRRDEGLHVLEVYPGSPAGRAGLLPDDRLLAIDGRSIEGESVSQVVARLRGREGTRVTVRVGRAEEVDVTITRARFAVPTVSSRMIDGDVGYLRISHVAKNSGGAAARALGGLLEVTALKGVVVDLRGNTGGSMLAAGQIADQLVDEGVLIETRGRDGGPVQGLRNRIDATGAGARRQVAVVILVDSRTGSSAEFLAAALTGHDRAILVGESTFGKGVLQKTYDLGEDGEFLLKVTVARAFAAGKPIPGAGLLPDVVLRGGDEPVATVSCVAGGEMADEAPVATVTLAAAEESADPRLAFAAHLVARHAALTRSAARSNIRRGLCDGVAGSSAPRRVGAGS
jgi:carboxyl-terminal processing protease